jgi:dipeptidyl aminopeptidase/acylaminoacyl peptidase
MFRCAVLTLLALALLQTAPPDTEIFLATLSTASGRVTLGAPVNISNSPGYDNQPSFTPDGRSILFTSVRGDRKPDPTNTAATGSDIYRYDVATQQVTRVTETPESEYSPIVTPDGQHFSVIRVEADGTQRLWRFTLDGRNPELVLTDVKPVGYHAWIDDGAVALFVLGTPATLQLADVKTGKAEVVARDIGRSIQRVPGAGISFVARQTAAGQPPILTISELTPATRAIAALVRAPAGASDADVAWTPDGLLLMASRGTLYGWRRGDTELRPVTDLAALGLSGVTRMAVSPSGDRIAMVARAR